MDTKRLRRATTTALSVAALLLGFAALALLGRTSHDSEQFGRLNDLLLLVNAAGAVVLLLLITGNLYRLVRDYRRGEPGTRLKARMLVAFVGLSVVPLALVYLFAVQFINEGIENWFDVEIRGGLADALELSRSALDVRMREDLLFTRDMAAELGGLETGDVVARLGAMRRKVNALELTVFGPGGRIVATSARDPAAQFPTGLSDEVLLQVARAGEYVALEPAADGRYEVRAAMRIQRRAPGDEGWTLQALYAIDGRLGLLADSVERSYSRYTELAFLREPLRTSFTVTLTLVVLLSFLGALYGAFFFARRLVAPVQSLVAGTQAVASGDLDTRLPVGRRDEIGVLIASFNEMIDRLAVAREQARQSAQQVERERARLDTILARLSTGVIATGPDGSIRIANEAAAAILGAEFDDARGLPLTELTARYPRVAQLADAVRARLERGEEEWREQVTLRGEGGRRVLVCACTTLPGDGEEGRGHLVVFDDVTALLQAQRDAAWREVARRLAHEIKNPLTPIQLSAERIRRRYLKTLPDAEAELLDRATHTIVQQVEAMRDMVNAFSEYARAPELALASVDVNQLIREVAFLYQTRDSQPAVELALDPDLARLEVDAVRIRQLLHNLIRNALEALDGQPEGVLRIETRLTSDGAMAELRVIDNGPGIPADALDRVFEPYVTTKVKGTGLGLAIVRKLVDEHGGTTSAENLPGGGARLTVRLPVARAGRDAEADGRVARPEMRRESA